MPAMIRDRGPDHEDLEQAGLNRRERQSPLVKERKEKGDAADAKAGEIVVDDRRTEGSNAKQGQPRQQSFHGFSGRRRAWGFCAGIGGNHSCGRQHLRSVRSCQ